MKEYFKQEGFKHLERYIEEEFQVEYKYEGEDLIPLAYTTDEDDETIEIQVTLDLNRNIIIKEVGHEERHYHFKNLEHFKEVIKNLDYSYLIYHL